MDRGSERRWHARTALLLVAAMALSRGALLAAGVRVNETWLLNHWQHADLVWLAEAPLETLLLFHAQPPLWNGILALLVQILGPDAVAVATAVHALNAALTLGAGLLMAATLRALAGPGVARLGALALVLSPGTLFYEAYAFYPHLTFFLTAVAVWGLLSGTGPGRLAAVLAALAALAWTWAVFHPALVLVAGLGGLVAHGRLGHRGAQAALAAAVLVAAAPTAKNAVFFGVPAASSWGGLNLAQVVPGADPMRGPCSFDGAREELEAMPRATGPPVLAAATKSSGFPNYNHRFYIARSRNCLRQAGAAITAAPGAYLGERLHRLRESHATPGFAYFFAPRGWNAAMAPLERAFAGRWGAALLALSHLAGVATLAVLALASPRRAGFATLLLLLVAFTLATHALNGGEQARMRHTVAPVHLLALCLLLHALWRRLIPPRAGRRARLPAGDPP